MSIKRETIKVFDMTCTSCERRVERTVKKLNSSNTVKATIKDGVQVINMTANVTGYTPNTLYVQKAMPVKWVVDGEEITGCNNTIVVPEINIQQKLQSGSNLIEFTPGLASNSAKREKGWQLCVSLFLN